MKFSSGWVLRALNWRNRLPCDARSHARLERLVRRLHGALDDFHGVISANSQDVGRLGQPMDNAEVMDALHQGKPQVFVDARQIKVLEPLSPIAGAAP